MKMVPITVRKLHDFVDLRFADAGKVQVQHAGQEVAIGFDGIDNLDGMVVDVPEIEACRGESSRLSPRSRNETASRSGQTALRRKMISCLMVLISIRVALSGDSSGFSRLTIRSPMSSSTLKVIIHDGVDQGVGQ